MFKIIISISQPLFQKIWTTFLISHIDVDVFFNRESLIPRTHIMDNPLPGLLVCVAHPAAPQVRALQLGLARRSGPDGGPSQPQHIRDTLQKLVKIIHFLPTQI